MPPPGFSRITMFLGGLAALLLILAVLALLPRIEGGPELPAWVVGAVVMVGLLALIVFHEAARDHFDRLRILRAGVEAVASGHLFPLEGAERLERNGGSLGEMGRLLASLAGGRQRQNAKPDQRLAAVLRAIHEGVVVITESGLVSLINAPAKAMLPQAVIGGSIYAVVDRNSLVAALQRTGRAGGAPVEANVVFVDGSVHPARLLDFGEHRGAVMTFASTAPLTGAEVELALDLHDRPPPAPAPVDATLLAELPTLVLDTETTGLDSAKDAIVSVGSVRCHGGQIFRSTVLDILVNPGRRIPDRARAVHGISDAMVADKPAIEAVLPEILAQMDGAVVVGHTIGFDLAMLARATVLAGRPWTPPQRLDIVLLAAALAPEDGRFEIDDLAARMGINVTGRHTALGDSLVTAEIWVRLIPQLERRGVRTLGEARAFARQAKAQWSRQKDMGWDEDTQLQKGGRP